MAMFQNAEIRVGTGRTALAVEGESIESAYERKSSASFGTGRSDRHLDFNGESRSMLQLR